MTPTPRPHEPGCLIFLHGASSAGKSTLARSVQARAPLPFWCVSFDLLRDTGALPMDRFGAGDFDWKAHRAKSFSDFHTGLVA